MGRLLSSSGLSVADDSLSVRLKTQYRIEGVVSIRTVVNETESCPRDSLAQRTPTPESAGFKLPSPRMCIYPCLSSWTFRGLFSSRHVCLFFLFNFAYKSLPLQHVVCLPCANTFVFVSLSRTSTQHALIILSGEC